MEDLDQPERGWKYVQKANRKRKEYEEAEGIHKLFLKSRKWIRENPAFSLAWLLVLCSITINLILITGYILRCQPDTLLMIRPYFFSMDTVPKYSENIWISESKDVYSISLDEVTISCSKGNEIIFQQKTSTELLIHKLDKLQFEEFLNVTQQCLGICLINQEGSDIKCVRTELFQTFLCVNANDHLEYALLSQIYVTAKTVDKLNQWYKSSCT